MAQKDKELKAFNSIVSALQGLESDRREDVIKSVLTFLGVSVQTSGGQSHKAIAHSSSHSTHAAPPSFSENRNQSPKQFLFEKQPKSDVERMACLAYYLTHFRDTPHFKTLELSKLNTEAAQPKFSNAAETAKNAVKQGYLVAATKGQRQLSAAAEQYVLLLPDRTAAKAAMTARVRRKSKTK